MTYVTYNNECYYAAAYILIKIRIKILNKYTTKNNYLAN